MIDNNKVVGGNAQLFDKSNNNCELKIIRFVQLDPMKCQFQECLEKSNK